MRDSSNPRSRTAAASNAASFLHRRNESAPTSPGHTLNYDYDYDIGGNVLSVSDGVTNLSISTTATPNYAASSAMTPNNNSNLGTSYTYDAVLNPTSVTTPNGAVASTTYDSFGRPTQSTSVHGAVTAYSYDETAHTQAATTKDHWAKGTMDGLGRVIKVEKGDSCGTKSVVDTVYGPCACSPMGRITKISQPYAPGRQVFWTTYTYDG